MTATSHSPEPESFGPLRASLYSLWSSRYWYDWTAAAHHQHCLTNKSLVLGKWGRFVRSYNWHLNWQWGFYIETFNRKVPPFWQYRSIGMVSVVMFLWSLLNPVVESSEATSRGVVTWFSEAVLCAVDTSGTFCLCVDHQGGESQRTGRLRVGSGGLPTHLNLRHVVLVPLLYREAHTVCVCVRACVRAYVQTILCMQIPSYGRVSERRYAMYIGSWYWVRVAWQ